MDRRAAGTPGRGAARAGPGFLAVLLAVQAALLIMLAVTVRVLASRRTGRRTVSALSGGGLAALIATLGFTLGGMLTAVISVGVTRLLGAPAPSGFRFGNATPDTIAVPWPVYAFGAAPVGLLLGGAAAAVLLGRIFVRRCRSFADTGGKAPFAGSRGIRST